MKDVESQVPRRVPMDITSVGASLTQVQDNNQVATLPSPVSGSQQMDTSRVGAASLTQVQNSTQVPVQISLSPGSRPTELTDIASQLQVLMSSKQTITTTVGQLRGQMKSLQAEVTEMKNADNSDDVDFDEHGGFPSYFTLRFGAMTESGEPVLESARFAPY